MKTILPPDSKSWSNLLAISFNGGCYAACSRSFSKKWIQMGKGYSKCFKENSAYNIVVFKKY